MKTVSLSGSPRENVGKKDAKSLRAEGLVPAVLYGGDEQIHLSLREIEVKKLIYTPDVYRIELSVGDKKYDVIIQEAQFHPVSDEILHVDFLQLFEDKQVKINLPVRITGNSIGVRNGGRLAVLFRKIAVKGLPGDIPESLEIDITKLRIGMSIRVRDVEIPGIKILGPDSAVIVGVKTARGAVDEDEEEEEEGAEGAEGGEGGEAKAEEAPAEAAE